MTKEREQDWHAQVIKGQPNHPIDYMVELTIVVRSLLFVFVVKSTMDCGQIDTCHGQIGKWLNCPAFLAMAINFGHKVSFDDSPLTQKHSVLCIRVLRLKA